MNHTVTVEFLEIEYDVELDLDIYSDELLEEKIKVAEIDGFEIESITECFEQANCNYLKHSNEFMRLLEKEVYAIEL